MARFTILAALVLSMLSPAFAGQSQECTDKGPSVAAIVNRKHVITLKEVDELIASQIHSLEERIYNLRRSALETLITGTVLLDEAARRGVSLEELKNALLPLRAQIPQTSVEQSYMQNAPGLAGMSEDEAKQRIRLDLENLERVRAYKAAVAGLREQAEVAVLLTQPVSPEVAVSLEGPSRGPADAPVVIVEFSDFQCPYCRQASETIEPVLEEYKDRVRLVFKHLPLQIHPQAFKAAQASVCASLQGKFWQYHDKLFASPDLSPQSLTNHAVDLSLDADRFSACLESEESRAAVLKDMLEAHRAEVQATPTFIVNGRIVRGVRNAEEFRKVIMDALSSGVSQASKENTR